MALAMAPRPWWAGWGMTELRIDVGRGEERIDRELEVLHRRLKRPGDALHGIASVPMDDPRFVIHHREADGEFYLYVEDVRRGRLAGTTVFNRLIELDRRADRYLRAPHSQYAPAYRRRGLATAIYRWGLEAGLCLITGARQSPAAHALWGRLARHYPLHHVDLRDKRLAWLGTQVSPETLSALHTRMLLLGRGWTLQALADATGMRLPD